MNFIQALALVRLLRGKNQGIVWYSEVGKTSTYVVYSEDTTSRRKYTSPYIFVYQRVAPAMAIGY